MSGASCVREIAEVILGLAHLTVVAQRSCAKEPLGGQVAKLHQKAVALGTRPGNLEDQSVLTKVNADPGSLEIV